ncbi:MAG TPA: Rieske 2Fe-2S domain-containing protein [Ginsengibacter sp.]|nr:Rieske 2Fe-2S domain-containing protein [Ginsengibacter sp.]HRP17466.1 Rieske 2Fe-2S domain-containing protein [Ginsengibacter sp.]HRP43326.1 Rieske 2Fe-2S domain-containing protein [Ginsengibacter sp.]
MNSQGDWYKVADSLASIPFNEKKIALIKLAGKEICLVNSPLGLRACTNRCPHAGGNLSEGFIDSRNHIVCCVHYYRFSLDTGRDALNEGYFLKTYPTKVNDEGVFVKV